MKASISGTMKARELQLGMQSTPTLLKHVSICFVLLYFFPISIDMSNKCLNYSLAE